MGQAQRKQGFKLKALLSFSQYQILKPGGAFKSWSSLRRPRRDGARLGRRGAVAVDLRRERGGLPSATGAGGRVEGEHGEFVRTRRRGDGIDLHLGL